MTEFPFKPRVVGWELTLRCNMKCIHCGSRAGEARPNELTEAEGFSLIDQMVELGTEIVTLSGGEPLMHPSWPAWASRLTKAGVRTHSITNGLLLGRNVSKLVDAGVRRVGISMDGTPGTHDFIRAHPGSFNKALAGAEAAMAAGLTVGAVTHVSRANFGDLEAMHAILREAGFGFWQIQMVFNQGRMRDHTDLGISDDQILAVARFVHDKQAAGGLPKVAAGDNLGYYCTPPVREKPWKGCFAGRHIMGVDADGSIKGCLSLPRDMIEGNIREESLRSIWEDENRFRYNRYFELDDLQGGCRDCPHGIPCRAGCTVTALSATGNRFDNPYCVTYILRQRGGK